MYPAGARPRWCQLNRAMGELAAIVMILSMAGDVTGAGAAAATCVRTAKPARGRDDLGAARDRLVRARFARDGATLRFFAAVARPARFAFDRAFGRAGRRFDADLRFAVLRLALRMIPSHDGYCSILR
jgi:hypothetical protein